MREQDLLTHVRDREHPTCVVCGNRNSRGLGTAFVVRPDGGVESSFYCDHDLAGYTGILHGGIISSLLDGAMTHCLFAHGKVALTAELRVRMRHPVPTGSVVSLRAWLVRSVAALHVVKAELSQNGRLAAKATAKFMEKGT